MLLLFSETDLQKFFLSARRYASSLAYPKVVESFSVQHLNT